MTACPMAWARWLFPVPGGPRKSASSRRPTNAAVARSKTRLRFIFLLKLKSKLSRVLCGSRNWAFFGDARAVGRRDASVRPTPDRKESLWGPSVPLGLAAGAFPAPQQCHRDATGAKHDSTRLGSFWLLLDFASYEMAIHGRISDHEIDLT